MPILVTAGIIKKGDRILVAQRKAGSHLEGMWEFPGGKIEDGEEPELSLKREIYEELRIEIKVGDIFHVVYHRYPDKDILLLAYFCEHLSGEGQLVECQAFKWITIGEMANYQFAPADIPIVKKLQP